MSTANRSARSGLTAWIRLRHAVVLPCCRPSAARAEAGSQVGCAGGGVECSDKVDHEVVECFGDFAGRLVVLWDEECCVDAVPAPQEPDYPLVQGLEQERGAVPLDGCAMRHQGAAPPPA